MEMNPAIGLAIPRALARLAKAHCLLLYPQNPVLSGLGHTKFDDGLGWNLDLLLRLGIKARARLPLLFHQLAKAGQNEFAVLLSRFVSESAERIEKYSSSLLIGLGCFGKSELKFRFGHL